MDTKKLTDNEIIEVSKLYGIEAACIKAVIFVESRGYGFYYRENNNIQKWDGEILVRFEGHHFRKFTKGKFDKHTYISYKNWRLGYKYARKGREEFSRFFIALNLNKKAALLSTSFGTFQIMGFNYESCGYNSVEEMVIDFYKGEKQQLIGFLNFCKSNNLLQYLRDKNWKKFAEKYNGKNYAANKYDIKLNQNYLAWKHRI